jgi:hypothetical protein
MSCRISPLAVGLITLSFVCTQPAVAVSVAARETATWIRRDLSLSLKHLPRRYTCAELTQKISSVLSHLGARSGAVVQPHRCERVLGSTARSPSVRLKFDMLAVADEIQESPEIVARWRDVVVEPGRPDAVDEQDCELLRQIRNHLPGKITRFRLACRVPQSTNPPFTLTFRVLIPDIVLAHR